MLSQEKISDVRKKIALDAKSEELLKVFEMASDPTRFCILRMLVSEKELCVTDIARVCEITVPAASHHLRLLEVARCVRGVRNGKMMCYQLEKGNPLVERMRKIITE